MAWLIAVGFWADYVHPRWRGPRALIEHEAGESERQGVARYLERGDVVEVYPGGAPGLLAGVGRLAGAVLRDALGGALGSFTGLSGVIALAGLAD
jgi:hypothetical protein